MALTVNFLENYDDGSLLSELRRLAASLQKETVTKRDIEASGRVSYSLIVKRFGSLRQALQAADLVPQRFMKATDAELLEILVELWQKVLEEEGRLPQRTDLKARNYPVSADTYVRRFGSWRAALIRASNSVETDVGSHALAIISSPQPERVREALSLRKRFFVMKRDSFACVLCGSSGHGVRLEVDHRVPFAKGGTDELDNLQTLCFDCNRGKRDSEE